MKRLALVILVLLVVGAVIVAVVVLTDSEDEKTEWSDNDIDTIRDIVVNATGDEIELEEEQPDTIESEEEVSRTNTVKYVKEVHRQTAHVQDITFLGLNDDILWPGNLLNGAEARDFTYVPFEVKLAPVTVSLSLESAATGDRITATIDKPSLSTFRQGLSDLLKDAITEDTTVPAKVHFVSQEVHSESDLSLFIGADVSYGAVDVQSRFDWSSEEELTRIVGKYTQVYYTVDVDAPETPAAVFAPSQSTDKIANALPPGSQPVYVSSVSYGMMALVFVETTASASEMEAALNAAYSGAVDVEIETGVTARSLLEQSSIEIVVYGGSTLGLNDLEQGYAGFLNVINASKEFSPKSPGVPLTYRFRYLHDNALANVAMTSEYTLVKPLRIAQRVRVTATELCNEWSDDEGADNPIELDRYEMYITAYNRAGENAEPVMIGAERRPVIAWADPSYRKMSAGDCWVIDGVTNSLVITFNTEEYDFQFAQIRLHTGYRDWDRYSSDEWAWGDALIIMEQALDAQDASAPGEFAFEGHYIIYGSESRFRIHYELKMLD